MARVCKQCRRTNPNDAAYCYHDGVLLDSTGGAGTVDVAARPFVVPFVFPSGRSCDNFNQLALACQQDPAGARGLLRLGHLETFLAAQGRPDLARAAHAAARAADRERGLDDFIGALPAKLTLARLHVEPAAIDLGVLRPGEDRRCDLVLRNDGQRLLYGAASCEGVSWLSLGDGPTLRRKLFQTHGRAVLPVRILGQYLHAYSKPQEGEIRLETSGGAVTVTVRVQVSVRPFPEGVLAGATSPRQLAEKTHEAPREAAALIESGAVARWYQSNGWTYPVQGPTASGSAAVQQLFEALGLARTPHLELSEERIRLSGKPGAKVEGVLAVVSQENRAAVAFGSSDQPWLQVGATIFRGRSAFLPLTIAAVPDRPGETLLATVLVTANGGQRFTVPVTLAVESQRRAAPIAAPPPMAVPAAPPPVVPAPAPLVEKPAPVAAAAPAPPPPQPAPARKDRRRQWQTLTPAGLLVVALLGVVLRDYLAPAGAQTGPPPEAPLDPVPRIEIRYHDARKTDDLERLWLTDPEPTMRFGVVELHNNKPIGDGINVRRLTFDQWGRTNNFCLRLDGNDERLFGSSSMPTRGRWEERAATSWKDDQGKTHQGMKSVWICEDKKIAVTQFVELVRGEQSNLLDTCRVLYRVENRDAREHGVGLRFLLDTFIGGNDGVPFTIPGDSDLCDTKKDLPAEAKDKRVPDFLQCLERSSLSDPGTIAHLRLKLGKPGTNELLEMPVRVTLGAWPDEKLEVQDRKANGPSTLWDVPVLSMKSLDPHDSAITVYWEEKPLATGGKRDLGFEYGLWNLARQGDRLAVTVDGAFRPDGQLTVVAYVNKSEEDKSETLTLELPNGFELSEGDKEQPVPKLAAGAKSGNRPVTWKVRAGPTGKYEFTVKSSAGVSQTIRVEVKSGIFD